LGSTSGSWLYWSGATSLDKRPALLGKRDQLSKTLIYSTLIRYTLKEYPVHQEPLREKTAMSNFIERLYTWDESAVCYKTRVYLFDENPATPEAQELQDAIKTSERVR
jgi:hypothetical protein